MLCTQDAGLIQFLQNTRSSISRDKKEEKRNEVEVSVT